MLELPTSAVPSRTRAFLLLGLLVLVWGVHWPIVKGTLPQVPPFTYGALRVATALPVVVAILAARRELARPPRADLPVLLVVGLGQIGIAVVLMNLALLVVPAGRSSILSYTSPFWAAIVQAILLGRLVRPREAAGIALGIGGVAILLDPGAIDWAAGALGGSLLLLLSAAIHGTAIVVVNAHRWRTTPFRLVPWQLLVALVPLTLMALLLEGDRPIVATPSAVMAILYSGPLATGFAYWASQSVARALPPVVTTMGMLATPVVGLLASSFLLNESITALDLVGFAVTGTGIAVVALARGGGGRAEPVTALGAGDELVPTPAGERTADRKR